MNAAYYTLIMARRNVAIALLAGFASGAIADDFNYINTSASEGDWGVAANWRRVQGGTGFPGDSAGRTDAVNINEASVSDYLVRAPAGLAGGVGTVKISNPAGGVATLFVAHPLVVGYTLLEGNGRLVIDGASVTGGNINFYGSSVLELNNGGARIGASDHMTVDGGAAGGAVVRITSADPSSAGVLRMSGDLRIGATAAGSGNALIVERGVSLTNGTLQVSRDGSGNSFVVDGAVVNFTAGGMMGYNGGSEGLVFLDNGAVVNMAGGLGAGRLAYQAVGHRVVVTNGSSLSTRGVGTFGQAGTNNSVVVTGKGSVWNMNNENFKFGEFANGGMSAGNVFRIEDGGVVANGKEFFITSDAGAGVSNRLVVSNGKLFGTSLQFGPTGRFCSFDVSGGEALVSGVSNGNSINIAFNGAKSPLFYHTGATGNVMRVFNGATVTNLNVYVGSTGAGIVGNRLEVSNGGRVFAYETFGVCEAGSNSWDNAAVFTGGSLLEANVIRVNYNALAPVGGNFISFDESVLQFRRNNPSFTINADGFISVNNSTVSFRGVSDVNVNCSKVGGTIASLAFSGHNALRFSGSSNVAGNQSYTFDKTPDPTTFFRLEMVDGATMYRTQNPASQALAFGGEGELFCSNTTAVVAMPCVVDGSFTVLDSAVEFTHDLAINGSLAINTDMVGDERNFIVVDGDLALGAESKLVVGGKSQEAAHICYNGSLVGRFAEKAFTPSPHGQPYAVSYDAANKKITIKPAPSGTLVIVK